jgi:2-polyprenyl-3-methyl-5-hydroxy-6-metoxy-1,4-benzoquinol methylase
MLNDQVKDIWNANAEFWDSKMREGNAFHKTLIEPTQLKLLNIQAGDKILDIACGNGQFARKMAELGAKVTAVDFSDKFIAIAKSKSKANIHYRVIDATSKTDLKKLDGNLFDSVVCTMALMDMENIEVLVNHLPKLLEKDGIVVFSVMHPCFNSGEITLVHEVDDMGGELKSKYSVKISNYLVERSILGVGMAGQPKPQYYFHRPLSTILKYFFANGFVLDVLEEPSFINIENSARIHDNVYKPIPPALVCRLRTSLPAK